MTKGLTSSLRLVSCEDELLRSLAREEKYVSECVGARSIVSMKPQLRHPALDSSAREDYSLWR